MMQIRYFGCILLLAVFIEIVSPICVLESDFGFKINCAFKKSSLFRVRNLGGLKAHASIGFSLGDELGFEQSLTNLDPSRRRSVSVKNGVPPNLVGDTSRNKQEKRGKQNRIMMRPMAPPISRPNPAAMEKLTSLHRRVSTMQPIVVGPTDEAPVTIPRAAPTVTMAKPMPMGVPPFKPLPPKEDTLKVVPITAKYSPLQIPQSKGPGLAYQNSASHQVHDLASYAYNTKKVDDYNSITGYSDDTVLKFNKEDINSKIAEIAKAGNISMEAVEAAIALRQQQLLSKYANLPVASTTTTSTTEKPLPVVFQPEPEEVVVSTQKPKRVPTTGKVMNAPREYYPVGYEKNFDDHFQSKVELPDTSFHCGDQKYFPGLYGDESLGCMVFHVCALTDDGLVMKSFLCPESTLFDQTILKCNWWFYVDCKNTRKLYDTNIPVSKSYQLMKALTFFSSYKKEMEDGRPANPEEVQGINEAITILENQDSVKQETKDSPSNVQIITPQPIIIDERNNHKMEYNTDPAPVYRENRNINSTKSRNNTQRNLSKNSNTDSTSSQENSSEYRLYTVKTDMNFSKSHSNASSSELRDKIHRRRMTLRYSNSTTTSKPTTNEPKTTEITTNKPITTSPVVSSPLVELIKQEIQPLESDEKTVKQEKLIDQLEGSYRIDPASLKDVELPEVKRVYRSSAEKLEDKEMAVINNEKVQIVRPTSMARLVGQFATPSAVISKLDEAILGRSRTKEETPETIRIKKEANPWIPMITRRELVTIVTPERHTSVIEKT